MAKASGSVLNIKYQIVRLMSIAHGSLPSIMAAIKRNLESGKANSP